MSQRDRIRLDLEDQAAKQSQEATPESAMHDAPQTAPTTDSPSQNILGMQRTLGNRAVQRMLGVQRVPFENGGELDDQLSNEIHSQRGSGGQLDSNVANTMSQQMGYDFSDVSVHTDANADRVSRSIGARAFTTGSDIFFKEGEYNPGSSEGQNLLAHELTHVVQQGGNAPSGKLSVGPANDSYEQEADSMASSVMSGDSASSDGVQRQAEEEEEMMMKRDIQREAIEEEDEMMMMRDDVQREELEEDEMQG